MPGRQVQASCLERTLLAPFKRKVRLGSRLPHRSLPRWRPAPLHPTWSGDQGHQADKKGKAKGTSLIIDEMLKAPRFDWAQQFRDQVEAIIHFGKIPTEWEESIIISLQGLGRRPRVKKLSTTGTFYDNKCASMTFSLDSCLVAAPKTPFVLYAS